MKRPDHLGQGAMLHLGEGLELNGFFTARNDGGGLRWTHGLTAAGWFGGRGVLFRLLGLFVCFLLTFGHDITLDS